MKNKLAKLIVLLSRSSDKMKSLSADFDKIAIVLQDPEILAIMGIKPFGVLSSEDYD